MRTAIICLAAMALIAMQSAFAQPLSGNYTVGGALPDFATFQGAADALKRQGVSGPTFFNIRPGTYTENGGNNRVLHLDSIITGLSAANRITFQADLATGGNVDNVILEMNRTNACTFDHNLVLVALDFVTLRSLTFQHLDSLDNVCMPYRLILIEGVPVINPVIDDLVLDGCKLIGSPYGTPTGSRGTDYGLSGNQDISQATITNNRFYTIENAVAVENGAGPRAGTIIVEDNEVYSGYGSGSAITVSAESASVKRNYVDFMGGTLSYVNNGIAVQFASVAFIEQNIVKNASGVASTFIGIKVAGISTIIADSVIVANNIIAGNVCGNTTGMSTTSSNTRFVHNTITNPPTSGVFGISVDAENCTILDNIIMNGAGSFAVVLYLSNAGSPGLISDHNILFCAPRGGGIGNHVAFRGTTFYTSLSEWQSASGLDTNSVFKEIEFVVDSLGLLFDECQSQDQDLIGIPIPGVRVDYYGAPRDSVNPFIGAVEGTPNPFDMFAAPFKVGLPGTPFSITAGKFDNLLYDGLAVPDYDNRQVHLFHYLPLTRSFEPAGTLSTDFSPVVVKFFDLDHDGNLDLVAGGDTAAVTVFWGDGVGGFPDETTVATTGRVASLDAGTVSFLNLSTILLTEDNGFLPNTSFVGFLNNENGRDIFHQIVERPGPPCCPIDTIPAVLNDFVVGDLDGNGDPELAALATIPLPPSMYVFNDTNAQGGGGFIPYGTRYHYQLGTGSLTDASSIVAGDFDGDLDEDLITTGASENQCVLIRNQGNFNFTSEPIATSATRAIIALDYENDGDLDLVAANRTLETEGVTVFLNNGSGVFTEKRNCFLPFTSGEPSGIIAADFDLDGMTDIAITTFVDSLFVLYNLGGGTTQVEEQTTAELPQGYSLLQNYPNPFNPTTAISYQLPATSHVTLRLYDILGRLVATIVDEVQDAGYKRARFNAATVASGVYFYRMVARGIATNQIATSVKKMMVLK